MADLKGLTEAISKGNRTEAVKLTKAAIDAGVKPAEILDEGLVPGMSIVGEKFKRNEAFVPEMLIAARAMKESMAILEPLLAKAGIKPKYTAVIGTVQGDLHDIGKNLVGMMLKGANIAVVDLGTNVSADKFVAAAKESNGPRHRALRPADDDDASMKDTVQAARKAGLGTKVIIGGAPITQQFADEIGADGYAPDAASAVDLVMKLVAH